MAYYCGECAVWLGSSDMNRYGERWCSYSRRYEKSDQQTYGCRGFVYAGRVVLTKMCEILKEDTQRFFPLFDTVRCEMLEKDHPDMLATYCQLGTEICRRMDKDSNKETLARDWMIRCIKPAAQYAENGQYQQALDAYRGMVHALCQCYGLAA